MTETAGDKAEGESETAAESSQDGQGLSGNAQKSSEAEKNVQDTKADAAADGQNAADPQSAAAGTEAQAAGQDQSQAQTDIPTAAGTAGDGQAAGGTRDRMWMPAHRLPRRAQPAAEHTNQAAYIVKAGDTLADICRMYYGTTDRLNEICTLNGISDPNTILLGQKILLP